MNDCLNETELLRCVEDATFVPDHLRECAACVARVEQLRASLSEIDSLLSELSEMPQPAAVARAAFRQPKFLKRIAAGAAFAACVLLAIGLSTRPVPLYRVDRFIPFDNRPDPIQLGTVIQLSVPASIFDPSLPASKKVQAEVLLGDDGRPRAVRFLD